MKTNLSLVNAIIYTGLSFLTATLFLAITLFGEYRWIDRIGGAIWVFLLSTIILMPIVIPLVKKRYTSSQRHLQSGEKNRKEAKRTIRAS